MISTLLALGYFATLQATPITTCPSGAVLNSLSSLGCICSIGHGSLNNGECRKCEPGTYSAYDDGADCTGCQPGYWSGPGASACQPQQRCDPNTTTGNEFWNPDGCKCKVGHSNFLVSPVTNMATCSPCPIGQVSAGGTQDCRACPLNEYASADRSTCINDKIVSAPAPSIHCLAGNYPDDSGKCVPCWEGTYSHGSMCLPCPHGTFSTVTGASDVSACRTCPFGTHSTIGATVCNPNVGENCGFSHYKNSKTGLCQPCGNYTLPVAGNGCACVQGYETFNSELGVCSPCKPGYYAPQGTTLCIAAPPGQFVAPADQTKLLNCGPGGYTTGPAATSCSTCDSKTTNGTNHPTNPTGCYCKAGFVKFNPLTGSCNPCDAGSYAPWNATSCTPAQPGQWVSPNDQSRVLSCGQASSPNGNFSAVSYATSCTACEYPSTVGTSLLVGSTSCICRKGYGDFNDKVGACVCLDPASCRASVYESEMLAHKNIPIPSVPYHPSAHEDVKAPEVPHTVAVQEHTTPSHPVATHAPVVNVHHVPIVTAAPHVTADPITSTPAPLVTAAPVAQADLPPRPVLDSLKDRSAAALDFVKTHGATAIADAHAVLSHLNTTSIANSLGAHAGAAIDDAKQILSHINSTAIKDSFKTHGEAALADAKQVLSHVNTTAIKDSLKTHGGAAITEAKDLISHVNTTAIAEHGAAALADVKQVLSHVNTTAIAEHGAAALADAKQVLSHVNTTAIAEKGATALADVKQAFSNVNTTAALASVTGALSHVNTTAALASVTGALSHINTTNAVADVKNAASNVASTLSNLFYGKSNTPAVAPAVSSAPVGGFIKGLHLW